MEEDRGFTIEELKSLAINITINAASSEIDPDKIKTYKSQLEYLKKIQGIFEQPDINYSSRALKVKDDLYQITKSKKIKNAIKKGGDHFYQIINIPFYFIELRQEIKITEVHFYMYTGLYYIDYLRNL